MLVQERQSAAESKRELPFSVGFPAKEEKRQRDTSKFGWLTALRCA